MSMLELWQVSKVYGRGATEVHALAGVSMSVDPSAPASDSRPDSTAAALHTGIPATCSTVTVFSLSVSR